MTTSIIQSMTMSLTVSPPEPLLQEGSVVVHDSVLVRTLWQEEPVKKDNCQDDFSRPLHNRNVPIRGGIFFQFLGNFLFPFHMLQYTTNKCPKTCFRTIYILLAHFLKKSLFEMFPILKIGNSIRKHLSRANGQIWKLQFLYLRNQSIFFKYHFNGLHLHSIY